MEEKRNAKKTIKDYIHNLMTRSLVTGVSNIVETKNNFRKFFKIFVLLFCIVGFFYQASLFLKFILTYPSVVDIEIEIPETFIRPAYTFCNNNGVKRTKFCRKYPDRCYVPEVHEFCEVYKDFCSKLEDKKNFTIVKPEYYHYEENITFQELLELGHDISEMIAMDKEGPNGSDGDDNDKDIGSSFMVRKDDGTLTMCYAKYLRVNDDREPNIREKPSRLTKTLNKFLFKFDSNEVFKPERAAGILFNLHSPFVMENPFENGILLRPGRLHKIHFNMEEEYLLPHPYESDCKDYIEEWKANGRKGYRSQKACIEKCELDIVLKDCNCTFPEVFYPVDAPFCNMEYSWCHKDLDTQSKLHDEYDDCVLNKCKDDCMKIKYEYRFHYRLLEKQLMDKSNALQNQGALVDVVISDLEVIKLKYRPQYQVLDVICSIGGFVGIWLGISLIAVVDFLESATMIAYFAFFKKNKKVKMSKSDNEVEL